MNAVLPCPLGNHGWNCVFHENMDVFQGADRLKSNPVLEPHHSLITTGSQLVGEIRLDEFTDEPSALGSDVAGLGVSGNDRASPYDDVGDVRSESIGPVVQEYGEVGGICERNLGDRGEREGAPGLRQTVLHEVVGHAAIDGLGIGCPFHVSSEVRRLTLQDREVVGV